MPGRQHSHFAGPELDLAGLDLALDLGHAQISGTLEAFLRTAEIAHLHLHDNFGFGGSDLHLPLGRGRLTPGLVQRLLEGCDGLCVLEHDSEVQFRQSLGFLSRLQLRRDVA
jgi:sugar phosphate isomerase/epimerase